MDRTSRYARCEAPTRSCTLSTTAANGHSQRNKETGEPDDATSIQSGSAGGWEKRPKGPRSQPTQLQGSSSTFACVSFPNVFAFQAGMWGILISILRQAAEHARTTHNIGEMAPEMMQKVRAAIRDE
jgi:Protein of unknown function (DUF1059)